MVGFVEIDKTLLGLFLKNAGTFFMYSGIAVVGLVLIYWLLPETKGRPLEEVIDVFKKPWCCADQYSTDSPYSPLRGSTHFSDDQGIYI